MWGATVSPFSPEGYGDALRRYARGLKGARGWKALIGWPLWAVLVAPVAIGLGALVIVIWNAITNS